MLYYHVWVRSERYRGNEPLTYSSSSALHIGAIVEVPLKTELVLGFVVAEVAKPRFATKPIRSALPLPSLPGPSIEIADWLQHYYPSPIGVLSQQVLPAHIHKLPDVPSPTATPSANTPHTRARLTQQQRQALSTIHNPDTYLLHGRTGSGKTRIYIELAARAIRDGKSALILVPEIGLTSQIAKSFEQVFCNRIVILHSQLTPRERTQAWLTILNASEPLVVIGPRSALFSPVRSLGLIVMDEAHDQAYKQEQPPYYQANRVAAQLRKIHGAILVLGSATPSVNDYYFATAKNKPVIRLDQLAIPSTVQTCITVVDIKDREQFQRAPHISLRLIQAIEKSLAKQEQSLLYLNRRGTARVTLCSQCGWQALCPNCDLPLTFHGDTFMLQCHICGFRQSQSTSCPICNNPSIEFRSFGTKAIVSEVQRIFPEAHVLRIDSDNIKNERLEHRYDDIIQGKVDILVGTQALAKGLDLPRLSTLGIIAADTSLFLPDYTAKERTYQLLTQVLGRIGRGHVNSQAVIQTYQPDSPLIDTALHDNWDNFYASEIEERRQFGYPPFVHILKLSCKRTSAASSEKAANTCKAKLLAHHVGIVVDGPAPAFHEKSGKYYRWQLIIKARNRQKLLQVLQSVPKGWSYDLDPMDLL